MQAPGTTHRDPRNEGSGTNDQGSRNGDQSTGTRDQGHRNKDQGQGPRTKDKGLGKGPGGQRQAVRIKDLHVGLHIEMVPV